MNGKRRIKSSEFGRRSKRKFPIRTVVDDDDRMIKKLEKALKLKKNSQYKRKAKTMFKNDGLDYILDVTDMNSEETGASEETGRNSKKKREENGKKKRKFDTEKCPSLEESSDGSEAEEMSESISDDDAEETKCSEMPDNDEVEEQQHDDGQQLEGPRFPHSKLAKAPVLTEDKMQSLERLKRQLKGLVNRLSESNMQPVSSEVESLYMRNSRNDVNELLYTIMYELIVMPTVAPQRLTMEQALLVAILQANTNSEVGTFILLKLVAKFNDLFASSADFENGKLCDNLLSFIAELYSFKVCGAVLIFDILKLLTDSFRDKDIDLILVLMQSVGGTLRKDDPMKMKEMIQHVQSKAASATHEKNSRVQFMLETLTAVHYNNLSKISSFSNSIREHLKKVLRNCTRPGCSVQTICVSYEDIIKENVSGSFQNFFKKIQPGTMGSTASDFSLPDVDDQVLKLASQQHMNSQLRKSIFCTIMSAEDYVDAFQKLLQLDPKNQFISDMVNIIVHCALHEKPFNPYYALLAGMFSKFSRKYYMGLQFSLWDRFKVLNTFKPYQIRNLSSFMVRLILKEELTLSVLKVIHFSDMNKHLVIFLREILTALLLHESDESFSKVFERIASVKTLDSFREEIYLFMVHFLLNEESKLDESDCKKLEERVKLVKKIFNYTKKQ